MSRRLSILLLPILATALEIQVDPATGSDMAAGTAAAPLATLPAALVKARPHLGKEAVTITLVRGIHRLGSPLVLTAADSGTKANPLTIAGSEGAIISGGRALTGLQWKAEANGIWSAAVPADLVTDQVFVNGEALRMARYPNWQPFAPGVKFNGSAKDAIAPERVATWADPTGGIVHAMHNSLWGDMSWTITGKDAKGLTLEGGWQNNRASKMHDQYRMVENIREELDAPGEWYHDRKAGRLLVIPPAGVDLTTAAVEAVNLKSLVEFQGTAAAPVRFVIFRGITFQRTARTFMENKEPLLRSDWTIYRGGALFFNGAEDCAVEDCTLDQLGGNAVFVNGYNRRVAIRRTEIDRCGTNAVAFVGLPKAVRNPLYNYGQTLPVEKLDLTPGPLTEDYPADCVVEDCLLSRFAQTEKQSTGVQIQMAARISILNSSLYDCPRAAINVGDGCWGGHRIEGNDVFDTVKETGDHGSFNAWGRDRYWVSSVAEINKRVAAKPGLELLDAVETTVLRGNRWRYDHDHGWDVDLDDGSSNYLIENNLCLNKGIKLREGFKRTVRNNICVRSGLHPHVWPEKSGDVITGNIFVGGYSPIGMPKVWGDLVDKNLVGTDKMLEASRKGGRDQNGHAGDPRFLNAAAGDFRVADGSPALAIGFVNFPTDTYGVRTPRLKAKARNALDTPIETKVSAVPAAKPVAWMGATIKSVTDISEVSATGLPTAAGVLLVEVPAGSAADKAGFQRMDVIVAVAETPVKKISDLSSQLKRSAGKPVTLMVRRNQADQPREFSGLTVP